MYTQGFIVSCLVFEVWMVPLVLMMVFLVQYGLVYGRGRHQWQLQAKKQAITTSSELSLDQAPVEVCLSLSERTALYCHYSVCVCVCVCVCVW